MYLQSVSINRKKNTITNPPPAHYPPPTLSLLSNYPSPTLLHPFPLSFSFLHTLFSDTIKTVLNILGNFSIGIPSLPFSCHTECPIARHTSDDNNHTLHTKYADFVHVLYCACRVGQYILQYIHKYCKTNFQTQMILHFTDLRAYP